MAHERAHPGQIAAIFYDLGDIFFEAHYWRLWMYEAIAGMGKFSGSFKEFYEVWEGHLLAVYEGREQYNQAYHDFLISLGMADIESFTAASFAKKTELEKTRKLFDGVEETLRTLHERGIRNYVVTDNELPEAEIRARVLGRFNINPYLDGVVSSSEAKATKSSPALFEYALKKYDLRPEEVLFVGHDREEIVSASGAGIRSIVFNNYLGESFDPAMVISCFAEILKTVGITIQNG